MSEGIIIAILSGVFTLTGTIITVIVGMSKTSKSIEVAQAVTNEKINNLTEEVKRHNEFTQRLPVLEEKVCGIDSRLREVERRGQD